MFRLVFGLVVVSFLVLSIQGALPIDEEWLHPIFYKVAEPQKSDRVVQPINYRLSGDAVPINYNIWLYPRIHLNDFTFSGKVQITFRAERDASEVTLHALQLKINDADLTDLSTQDVYFLYVKEQNTTTDFLTFASLHAEPFQLVAGQEYLLTITYEGSLRTDNGGFYLSSYENDDGEEEYIATTQFQATDARHAFPCFDEPGYKATFDIAIRHGREFSAISNMPLERFIDTDATTRTSYFQTTPKMSTYLIAFVVSKFESTEDDENNIRHRVFSRPNAVAEHPFALETSKKALNYLATYLDVPYHLPKMDNVAIPDFGAGAMENWGLVTYREEYLLYDQQLSTVNTELNIAIMISHEFTHQWFGDLVTLEWWQYLWLNEGFASLYEYLTVNEIYPHYDIMQNFAIGHFQRALLSDGIASPRAMSTYVEDPASISGIFDSVSYAKAACVLRMFQHVLGESNFKKGLSSYLKANAYGVVNEDDLFEHLIEAAKDSNIPGLQSSLLKSFFQSWTQQGGYPVLTVTRDYSAGTFLIDQHIFDNTNDMTKLKTFIVPYNYVLGNKPSFENTGPDGFLLGLPTATVNISASLSKADDWLLLNKQLTGYYRVNYDEKNWNLLASQLLKDHKVINVLNRAQLIDDSVRLAIAGRLYPSVALNLMEYIKNEEDYAPWAAANNVLAAINTFFLGDSQYELYLYYVNKLVSSIYGKLGITEGSSDTVHQKLVRNIAINWACRTKAGTCLDDANKRLNEVIDTGKEVEPSLKVAIFCNGLISGGEKEFVYIFRRILDSNDQAERRQLIPTLGCSTNETLLLEFARTATAYSPEINYRTQERGYILSGIIDKNEVGLLAAITFLREDYESYYELGAAGFMDSSPLMSILSSIASRIYSQQALEEFMELIAEIKEGLPGSESRLDTFLVKAIRNVQWIDRNRDSYIDWLGRFKNSATSAIVSSATLVVAVALSLRSYL